MNKTLLKNTLMFSRDPPPPPPGTIDGVEVIMVPSRGFLLVAAAVAYVSKDGLLLLLLFRELSLMMFDVAAEDIMMAFPAEAESRTGVVETPLMSPSFFR